MAGEVTGKIYEAITRVALELAIAGNRKGLVVLWHEQPKWISIEADLAVGKNADEIEALVMVTHSRSEKLSEKKFWRNAGELCQWKIQGPKPVRCYNVIFEAAIKAELKKVELAILDGILEVESTTYGKTIISYVRKRQNKFGSSDDKRREHVLALITKGDPNYDPDFAKAIALLRDDLTRMTSKANAALNGAWTSLRIIESRKISIPPAKNTYVRNGIAKLILLDKATRTAVYDAVKNGTEIPFDKVPRYALELQLIEEGMSGCQITDTELNAAVSLLGSNVCEQIVALAPARMQDFIDPLRSVDNIDAYSAFIEDKFADLSTPSGMLKWLKACYTDPVGILPTTVKLSIPPRDVWLFVYCITLEKANQEKIVAYGLSSLAADSGVPDAELRFAMPAFAARQAMPSSATLKAVARVFANKVRELGLKKLKSKEFVKAMKAMLIQRGMYVLSTYRNFDPLTSLVQAQLLAAGIASTEVIVPTFFKEIADVSSSTSTFIQVGHDTLIYCQSCHGSHVNDKAKELSARFRATKLKWNGKKFVDRSNAKNLYFIADGEWRVEDFDIFMRSGVDRIFYPDQMDELIKALGGKKVTSPTSRPKPLDEG